MLGSSNSLVISTNIPNNMRVDETHLCEPPMVTYCYSFDIIILLIPLLICFLNSAHTLCWGTEVWGVPDLQMILCPVCSVVFVLC